MPNELKTLSEILLAGKSAIEKEESKEIISELIEFSKLILNQASMILIFII